ncbi:murein DD-endopeptidase MepM/ murein hydrolase activator NlpD [Neisseria sp. HSC-16F19]|nr:peptidoglycan DD-metalloendopeptidase family protein [Neisseria sp. HSC-16F19]MCP2040564.1 murein DD-endopeptidase MepM/ murein hydrolase activator NlpD [Neisseria sp. HSC-16F19]
MIQFAQGCRSLGLLAAVSVLTACAGNSAPSGSRHSGPVPDGYYRVQKGDNLYRIGQRFGQSVNTLAAWNGLRDPGQIEVGQLLRVRSGKSTRSTAATPAPRSSTARNNSANTPATASRSTPAATGSSRLQWPVSGPILSAYNGSTQKGIDIGGSRGTPVKAAGAGTVMYVGSDVRGYGNLVLIRHTQAMLTAYAHADSVRVRQGEQVSAGQTIATMGDSGTDRVKLHFEVRVNGQAVNPTGYLPKN